MSKHCAKDIVIELLRQGTCVTIQPQGPSMYPLLREADRIEIRPCQIAELRRGHILLVRQQQRLILHRLVHIKPTLQICGDAQLTPPGTIDPQAILGLATTRWRGNRATPIDTRSARWIGMLWFWGTPLQRLYWKVRHRHHAAS